MRHMTPFFTVFVLVLTPSLLFIPIGKVMATPGFVNAFYGKVLDICTPYRLHINTNFTSIPPSLTFDKEGKPTYTNTCAVMLGEMKSACDLPQRPNTCSDPRYQNWLVNDYSGAYPVGTWDYSSCYMSVHDKYCPPPLTVRP